MRGKIIKSRPKYWLAVIFAISFLMMIGTCSSTNAASLNVDNHSKADIVNYIKNSGVNLNDKVEYTIDPVFNTTPGNMTEATKQGALKMLNNIRYVAGVPAVALDDTYGVKAQAAAFALAAVGTGLSHYPKDNYTKPDGMPDSVWDTAHSGAGLSNLAAGKNTLNLSVLGWMDDSDANNIEVIGHRRWAINPKMGKTGFGAASRENTDYKKYYTEYSHDQSGTGAQTNVAWPARYMPIEYFEDDIAWSLSTGTAISNTSNVSVTLNRRAASPSGAGSWTFTNPGSFTAASSGKYFNVENRNYGQPGCIIFRPDNIKYKRGDIFDVTINGAGAETISYTVEFIQGYPIQSIDLGEDVFYTSPNDRMNDLPLETVPADAGRGDLIWETSDSSIATVTDGKITPIKPGRVTITCKAPASCTETGSEIVATKTVVVPKAIDDSSLEIKVNNPEFTGEIVRPTVTIVDTENDYTLVEGKDYSLNCPKDLIYPSDDTGTVWIRGLNGYGGSNSTLGRYYWVQKKTITKDMIELSAEEFEYDGTVQKPVVSVKNGMFPMTIGTDYTVSMRESKEVGEYTVTVYGAGNNYTGSASTKYTITKRKIKDQMVSLDETNIVYNGSEQEPIPVVKDGETTLVEGTDYELSYSNNKNVGTAKVTITGKGNYQDSIEKTFTINKKALTLDMLELSASEMGYTGTLQKPGVTVSDGDALKDSDYTITNEGGTERGAYDVVVAATAGGNYTGTVTKQFNITPKALTADMVDIGSETFTYNGKNQKPNSVTVKNGNLTLEEGTDYTLTNSGGTNARTYKVTVTAKEGGNYSGSAEKEYAIDKKELSADMVSLGKTEFDYNGNVQKPEVTVSDKVDGDELISNDDYEITNDGGTNAGEYKVTVTAKEGGNYKDPQQQIEQSYTIKTKSLKSEDIKVSAIDDTTYNGSEQKPKPVVNDGETTLVEGTDYELSYSDNTNAGTAKVTITGKGNYQDSVEKTFTISKKALTADMVELSASEMGYTGTLQKPGVTVSDGDALKDSDYTITNEGGTERGTYDVVVAAAGGNYTGTVTKQFNITPKTLTADMVDIGSETFTYNGKNQKPNSVTVKNGELTLEEGTDYTLTNEGGTNAGTYKVIVTAKEGGNYSGAVIKEYTIKEDKPIDNPINDPTDDPNGGKPDENPVQPGQTPGNTSDPGSENTEQPADQKGADGTALGQGASAEAAEAAITGMKSDKDPAGSAFGKLQLRSTKQTRNSIKLAWKKVGGAVKYVVYGNQCGIKNKMKKIREVSSASFNVKNIEGKKLKKGTSYKFILVAIDRNNKVVSSSKVIHVFTAGGKNGNHKKVIVKAKVGKKLKAVKKLTIKVRKKVKLKTQLVLAKKKLKVKKHAAVRFESDKPKIAVVSKAGVVKGLKKGKCTIFAYAQNGVYAKIKVTVK